MTKEPLVYHEEAFRPYRLPAHNFLDAVLRFTVKMTRRTLARKGRCKRQPTLLAFRDIKAGTPS